MCAFVQTNHLGHFVIAAHAAAGHLKNAARGKRHRPLRVVSLSSVAARSGSIHWDDLQVRYRHSHLENMHAPPPQRAA